MKLLIPAILTLTLGLPAGALAQQPSPQTSQAPGDASASQHSDQQPNAKGAKPEGMGASGWSGPHRGETTGSAPTTPYVPSPSKDTQPPVVTGEDLQGQPKAFPSNKTPE